MFCWHELRWHEVQKKLKNRTIALTLLSWQKTLVQVQLCQQKGASVGFAYNFARRLCVDRYTSVYLCMGLQKDLTCRRLCHRSVCVCTKGGSVAWTALPWFCAAASHPWEAPDPWPVETGAQGLQHFSAFYRV